MRHPKQSPNTVLIVFQIDGEDYYRETKRGYSEEDAYQDILTGQIEDVQQVLLMTPAGCEDITARMANRICRAIEWDPEPNESAARFAEDFSADYERPVIPGDDFWNRVDAAHDRAN